MIIQVAGTNGSGKTTVMRAVMARVPNLTISNDKGKITGYRLEFPVGPVVVVGRYTDGVATGGCDALKSPIEMLAGIEWLHGQNIHVLFEGIRMMNHMRGIDMQRRTKAMHIFLLTTSYEECVKRIMGRREASGGNTTKPLSGDVRGTMTRARNYADKLQRFGAVVYRVSSEAAFAAILNLLGVK